MSDATDALAAGCQQLTEAVRASCVDPADAVRVLSLLVGSPAAVGAVDPSARAAQLATAALLRRCGLVSLALACADYTPASSTEALAVRAQVAALFDAEIVTAADAGERDVYGALRVLRTATVADLTTRAANLPALITVQTSQPEPSLVLAFRLYGTAYREPGLTARAGVVHPLFVPTSFEALSPWQD